MTASAVAGQVRAPTLMDELYAHAEARPGHPAVVHGDARLGYGELVERVEGLAQGLSALGVEAGDAVVLLMANSPDMVVSFFAVTALGAVVTPLNPAFKQDELTRSFRDCGVRAVIADADGAPVVHRILAGWDAEIPVITPEPADSGAHSLRAMTDAEPRRRLQPRDPDDSFVYQFSSGSTGRPKRVMRTHGQCRAEADAYVAAIGMTPEERIFCPIPLFHTYGMGLCLLAFARSGATLVLLEEPNPFVLRRARALELIERERATIFAGVPFNYRLLAEAPEEADLGSLRMCFSAGTALPRPAFEAFAERCGIAVRQLYGCTEAGVLTINLDPDPYATRESVGTPVPGVTVEVVDAAGAPVPAGAEGEILVGSPTMTRRYEGEEELSRHAFRDGRYVTGDLGRLDADGRLTITGRTKLLIEVAGNKVDPIEVEDVLLAHAKVREAVVVGLEGRAPGEQIVKAAVVAREECTQRELIDHCRRRLANYKVPQLVEFRDELPRSPLGKILRKYLV